MTELISMNKTLGFENAIALPDMENEPHLLITKVRKHYMEYIIKLLSVNYEKNQKALNKNIRLPSAIWRCAKSIEMSAAHTCMVVDLYRKNIISVINDLKHDTRKGKLYNKLYEYINKHPENEKKVQTVISKPADCMCECICSRKKKRRKSLASPRDVTVHVTSATTVNIESCTQVAPTLMDNNSQTIDKCDGTATEKLSEPPIAEHSDELMQQLEMLFHGDYSDEQLYDTILCDMPNKSVHDVNANNIQSENSDNRDQNITVEHSKELKSNEVASIDVDSENPNMVIQNTSKKKHTESSKWLCEEYFLKLKLYELLDQLRDCNRAKLSRIKLALEDLFGNDSDDEGVMSPLEETNAFVISCKERIAPWVVHILTPYYVKGRIKGKPLFKSVAKHLIKLIYQCSKYPSEFEVKTFVSDFLENHKTIRCEADFKHFRIDNF